MNCLTIDDLGFLEKQLTYNSLKGGNSYSVATDSGYRTAKSSGYVANYQINRQGVVSTQIGGYAQGAIAGAVAGAVAVGGNTIAYVSTSAGV